MAEHDFIQFQASEEDRHILLRAGVKVWPPPEEVWMVYPEYAEPDDGLAMICIGDEGLAEVGEVYGRHDIEAVITPFKRVSYSKLPDDMDFTHVARGALYVVAMDPERCSVCGQFDNCGDCSHEHDGGVVA